MGRKGESNPDYDFALDPFSRSGKNWNLERPIEATLIQLRELAPLQVLHAAYSSSDLTDAIRFDCIRNVCLVDYCNERPDLLFIAADQPLCVVCEVKQCRSKKVHSGIVDEVLGYRDHIRGYWSAHELQRFREYARRERGEAIDSVQKRVEHIFRLTRGQALQDSFKRISNSPFVNVQMLVAVDTLAGANRHIERDIMEYNAAQKSKDDRIVLACVEYGTTDSERRISSITIPGVLVM